MCLTKLIKIVKQAVKLIYVVLMRTLSVIVSGFECTPSLTKSEDNHPRVEVQGQIMFVVTLFSFVYHSQGRCHKSFEIKMVV